MIEYCKKSMECHKRSEKNALSDIASSFCNIGLANMNLENLEEALANFKECLRVS